MLFALGHGFAQVQNKCNQNIYNCQTCYDAHLELGWQCPQGDNDPEWAKLGKVFSAHVKNGTHPVSVRVCEGTPGFISIFGIQIPTCSPSSAWKTYTSKETRISDFTTWTIDCGGAMLFTDDGGLDYKYQINKDYTVTVKSINGLPLRVRVFEMAVDNKDILTFYEVKRDAGGNVIAKEKKKVYGSDKGVDGAVCHKYSWCRNYDPNPTSSDITFNIESGEAEIHWYSASGISRAGWAMVIDVLSAKIKNAYYQEISECEEDELVVEYEVVMGSASNSGNVTEVQFALDGVPFTDAIVTDQTQNVKSWCNAENNSHVLRIPVGLLGGEGDHTISITSVTDEISTAYISSTQTFALKNIRVKAKPIVQLGSNTVPNDVCSGVNAVLDLNSIGDAGEFTIWCEEGGSEVLLGKQNGVGEFSLGTLTNSGTTARELKYKVQIQNLTTSCKSDIVEYSVRVLPAPTTGSLYNVP